MDGKKKALILIDHGSKVNDANNMLKDIAEMIKEHDDCGFDIVTYSHMELAEPTLEQAFRNCVENGADFIIVHPYFLVPGRHSKSDIPEMARRAAENHPHVRYHVTEPLGIHEKIVEVILERSGIKNK